MSTPRVKIAAVICVYDDISWLPQVVESAYEACDKIVFLVSNHPWNGEPGDLCHTVDTIAAFKDPANKMDLHRGDWMSETYQRNFGLKICESFDCELCFVLDADEVYEPEQLLEMFRIARNTPQIDCFNVSLLTYWKSPRYRIDPPEPLQPPALVRVGKTSFRHNRAVDAETYALIAPEVAVCHHLSYARTDEQILRKLATFSHADELVPHWYENVWQKWDTNPSLRNLHPTHPAAYGRAIETSRAALPACLQSYWELQAPTIDLKASRNEWLEEATSAQPYLALRAALADHRIVSLAGLSEFGKVYLEILASELKLVSPNEVHRAIGPDSIFCCLEPLEALSLTGVLMNLDSNTDAAIAFNSFEQRELISSWSEGTPVTWLGRKKDWPHRFSLDAESLSSGIALIGNIHWSSWPTVGISIPSVKADDDLVDASLSMVGGYPGEVLLSIVVNGELVEENASIAILKEVLRDRLHVEFQSKNTGFGAGANTGLQYFASLNRCDLFAVSNDDVIPATDCVSEMVLAMRELERMQLNPGVIGPVSNAVHGHQSVDIGAFSDYREMLALADARRKHHRDSAIQTSQIRGLFMLIHPNCLQQIGGFDPIFGLGNCEDDDHNVRCQLGGFTLWVSEGAFLYHAGSQTFQSLGINYSHLMKENSEKFCSKWQIEFESTGYAIDHRPENVSLFVPLDSSHNSNQLEAAA